MHVIELIIRRSRGEVGVNETAIGGLPDASALSINGLSKDDATLKALLEVDPDTWSVEMEQIKEYLEGFGERLPAQMIAEPGKVEYALKESA